LSSFKWGLSEPFHEKDYGTEQTKRGRRMNWFSKQNELLKPELTSFVWIVSQNFNKSNSINT